MSSAKPPASHATSNQLSRFLFDDLAVRGIAVQLGNVWQDIHTAYDYPAEIRRILGESVAATAMLAGNIKFDGTLKLQIQNSAEDQPVQWLLAQCRSDLQLRGLVHWRDFATDFARSTDLLSLTGSQIALTLQHDNTGRDYQGLIDASSGSLATGLEAYYEQSEQLPTRMWLFINDHSACGFMLQRLPAERGIGVVTNNEQQAKHDELDDGWKRLQLLADTLKPEEIAALPMPEILHRLYHEENVQLLATRDVQKYCPCVNEQRIENMLKGLGHNELQETIEQEGIVRVNCEFCNTDFEYDAIDVQQLFNENSVPGSDLEQ